MRTWRDSWQLGFVMVALQHGQVSGGSISRRDSKSNGSPWRLSVEVEYMMDSPMSRCSYWAGRSMVATHCTSAIDAFAVSTPHCLARDNISALCITKLAFHTS